MKKLILWPSLVVIGALLAATAFVIVKPQFEVSGPTTDKNTQIVNAISRTQEVALVTLGIEGIRERATEDGKILFLSIPNSRAAFLRYSFDAKLGFNAEDVTVEAMPDGSYKVSIPSFIVIGLNNQHVETAAEANDVLSWTTAEIDKVEMMNDVFGDEVQSEYLTKNDELLKDQARMFYTNIVTAIDPETTVNFEFDSSVGVTE